MLNTLFTALYTPRAAAHPRRRDCGRVPPTTGPRVDVRPARRATRRCREGPDNRRLYVVSSARAPNASSQRPSSTPGSCCSTAGRSGRMDLKQPRSGTQALRAAVQSALRGEVQLWKKDVVRLQRMLARHRVLLFGAEACTSQRAVQHELFGTSVQTEQGACPSRNRCRLLRRQRVMHAGSSAVRPETLSARTQRPAV